MELYFLRPGHKVRMRDGAEAEVLSETEDGEWIKVRYLGGNYALFADSEDLAHRDEVESLRGVVHEVTWGDDVTVMLHRVPETEEGEGEYEAVTTKSVPHGVIITASDPNSTEEALDHLLNGLRAFGFQGRVEVEDATGPGRPSRYEVQVE